ncbi:sensor histidine kinase [Glycomyces algeriensis]|uniref:Oxygen sensor histidine kinase NreB n=1 Tax=Glycomyces algeriensis TaxID=256037 RepID=A0A9W6LE21_9ACTN|nr:sensor histidine kinase [Glycomyces algeriensis]MDA1368082.1 sensor histidine kinase [Glycomyces algeriensis]MDR7352594.1 signal transduction histidine kinase [Glycomyces algeriensis]GLI40273.1 histidine kinase [Glycomyces algeriensis]
MASASGRLDRWERRLQTQMRLAPYALLAVSLLLYWLTVDADWTGRLEVLGVCTLAAAWMRYFQGLKPSRVPDGAWQGAYLAGLITAIAALGSHAVWFTTFFGFTGFLHSWWFLKGPWRFAGVTATAAVSVATYTGFPPGDATEAFAFVLFTAAIAGLVALFSFVGDVTSERSAERKRTVDRLEAALAENAGLHAQLLVQAREAGVMDERQRIAGDLHDTLAQGLAGIIAQLQAAPEEPDWRPRVDKALMLARANLAEARRTVHAVGPSQLEAAALPEALEAVSGQWAELHGIPVAVNVTGTFRPLDPDVEGTLLRVAQESLANAGKHAGAGRVGITLSYIGDVVALDVLDDGRGFELDRVSDGGGFGLDGMRRRVERLGGTFAVESARGEGTAVSATVPALERDDDRSEIEGAQA